MLVSGGIPPPKTSDTQNVFTSSPASPESRHHVRGCLRSQHRDDDDVSTCQRSNFDPPARGRYPPSRRGTLLTSPDPFTEDCRFEKISYEIRPKLAGFPWKSEQH